MKKTKTEIWIKNEANETSKKINRIKRSLQTMIEKCDDSLEHKIDSLEDEINQYEQRLIDLNKAISNAWHSNDKIFKKVIVNNRESE